MMPASHTPADVAVILVAAGRGERLGVGTPKAFVELSGLTLIERCVRTVTSLPWRGQLLLVIPEAAASQALQLADTYTETPSSWTISVVPGGQHRHESVRNGLDALEHSVDTVLVHDAARPLAPADLFTRVLHQTRNQKHSVVPVLPVVDTLKRVRGDGEVVGTEDRSALMRAQTPQGFSVAELTSAHRTQQLREAHRSESAHPTDDTEVVQRAGGKVFTVAGSPRAHKVTTIDDLHMLEGILRHDERDDT
jgi:2-C-methyl-D-erythritol 4-phosphate cytidylyltransferase